MNINTHPQIIALEADVAAKQQQLRELREKLARVELPATFTADDIAAGRVTYELAVYAKREEEWALALNELEARYPGMRLMVVWPEKNVSALKWQLLYTPGTTLAEQFAGVERWWQAQPAGQRVLDVCGNYEERITEQPDGTVAWETAYATTPGQTFGEAATRVLLAQEAQYRRDMMQDEDDE